MLRWSLTALALLLACHLLTSPLSSCNVRAYEDNSSQEVEEAGPIVCFVVRTYWGHGDTWGDQSLRNILVSFLNQTSEDWEALIVVMDNRPFPELRQIIRDVGDDRIWAFAEWINYKYAPKEGKAWTKNYHNKLYNLTDEAIRACPPNTRWVVATNGDNEYDPHFVQELLAVPEDVDAVAFDYYSRYQRPTGPPCERFQAGEGLPPCKENDMRFCQTDLAANAYNLDRLIEEKRRFGLMDPDGSSGANDGIMAQTIKAAGWKIHHVSGRCLVNHAPSPQQCAAEGGVWDDSAYAVQHYYGGTCLAAEKAKERLAAYPTHFELYKMNVSVDPASFDFGDSPVPLSCIRLKDRAQWTGAQVFGRVCAAEVDYPNLPDTAPHHPWDTLAAKFGKKPTERGEAVQEGEAVKPTEGGEAEGGDGGVEVPVAEGETVEDHTEEL